jgi:hypothetical protein
VKQTRIGEFADMDKTETAEKFKNITTLTLELEEEQLASLFFLLQGGFFVEAVVGCTIEDFFVKQLALSPDYIQTRIQGIFLDGKPTDHIDTAIIRNGARLSLSGTMPGLAGMALRSGPLAVFRHGITHRETGDYGYTGDGFVELKLMNLLLKEMGPELLRKGIYLGSSKLAGYLSSLPAGFWQGCNNVLFNSDQVSPDMIQKGQWVHDNGMVKFSAVVT